MAHRIPGLYRRGKWWWFAHQVQGARTFQALGTQDEGEAIARALAIRGDPIRLQAGRWEHEVRRYLEERSAAGRISRATRSTKGYVLRLFAEQVGIGSPDQVTHGMVRHWHAATARRLRPSTANDYLAHLRPFLAHLVRARKLRSNPGEGIEAFPVMRSPRKVFVPSAKVEEVLGDAVERGDRDLAFLLYAGFDAGMRKLEILEATPQWFALSPGSVWISRTERFEPKDREERAVPLTQEFQGFLASHAWEGRWMFRPAVSPGKGRYRTDPRDAFRSHMTRHGLSHVTMHDMRRSFASNLAMAGVSIYKIAQWLGDEVRVVEARYAHLAPQDGDIDRLRAAQSVRGA